MICIVSIIMWSEFPIIILFSVPICGPLQNYNKCWSAIFVTITLKAVCLLILNPNQPLVDVASQLQTELGKKNNWDKLHSSRSKKFKRHQFFMKESQIWREISTPNWALAEVLNNLFVDYNHRLFVWSAAQHRSRASNRRKAIIVCRDTILFGFCISSKISKLACCCC